MKLNEVFPDWADFSIRGGIFSLMGTMRDITLPWGNDEYVINYLLDLEYHGNISGDKEVSPLVCKLIENEDTHLYTNLCATIFSINGRRWQELYNTQLYEYDPIENYSMTEKHTGTDTSTQTPSNWKTTNEALQADNESVNDTSVYAFNSSDELPTGKTKSKTKNKNEVTQSGTYETETEYNTTLTRSGNIGVTTSQQMIQSQRDLVKWDFFREVVFPDIDKILCLGVY